MIRLFCVLVALLLGALAAWPADESTSAPDKVYVGVLEIMNGPEGGCRGSPPQPQKRVWFVGTHDAQGWQRVNQVKVVDSTGYSNVFGYINMLDSKTLPPRMTWYLSTGARIESGNGTFDPCTGDAESPQRFHYQEVLSNLDAYADRVMQTYLPTIEGDAWYRDVRLALVTTSARVTDPDSWIHADPGDVSDRESRVALREFRRHVSKRPQCTRPETGPARNVAYSDGEVLVTNAYRSLKSGVLIIAQKLAESRFDCQWANDPVVTDYWFAIYPDGTARPLGERLEYIGAADLDGNGESEVIFRGRQRAGAYSLFYDGLSTQL